MAYLLNGTDLSTFGIIPTVMDGNIAVSGCFDLTSRIGDISHDWADEDGVEPFVDSSDMAFSGRDIEFKGIIVGTRDQVNTLLAPLYTLIKGNGLIPFSTPYGTFSVYTKAVVVKPLSDLSELNISLREPQPNFSTGTIPSAGSSDFAIDGRTFSDLKLVYLSQSGITNLPDPKQQNFTIYNKEGYQRTKRNPGQLQLTLLLDAANLTEFIAKIKSLQTLFASSGTRTVKLAGISYSCFAKDGFKVSNVIAGGRVLANLDISLTLIN